MAGVNDYPARGRIKSVADGKLVFLPSGTNYELHLQVAGDASALAGLVDQLVDAQIRVTARKIWTVPSGGNFIAPIFGSPRTIQGRVKWLDNGILVVHAGMSFAVELPAAEQALDLAHGAVEAGALVNVTALPGAKFTLIRAVSPAPAAA